MLAIKENWSNLSHRWKSRFTARSEIQYRVREILLFGPRRNRLCREVQLTQAQLEEGVNLGNSHFLKVELRLTRNGLRIKFPENASLYRSRPFGWKTVWDGQSQLIESSKNQTISIQVQPYGDWKVSYPSIAIEITETSGSLREPRRKMFQVLSIKHASVALAGHLVLFALIFGLSQIQLGSLSQLLHQKNTASEVTPEIQAQSGSAEVYAVDPSTLSFSGISLWKALKREVEKNFKVTDVAKNLKGLGQLLKSNLLSPPGKAAGKPGPQDSASLAQSLKSLQSGLAVAGAGNRGGTTGGGGAQAVHWKSEFMTHADQTGKSLTEGQQQILSETFNKMQDRVRGCYEAALLKFDELSVTVSFEAEINSEGRIGKSQFRLSGRSTPESQESLIGCLKGILGQAKFDSRLSGTRFKNQFIFKS